MSQPKRSQAAYDLQFEWCQRVESSLQPVSHLPLIEHKCPLSKCTINPTGQTFLIRQIFPHGGKLLQRGKSRDNPYALIFAHVLIID